MLVEKDSVANIRIEEKRDGTLLVHDITTTPVPFEDMDAVLRYFADSNSPHNNRVPITHAAPRPGSARFESRYSVSGRASASYGAPPRPDQSRKVTGLGGAVAGMDL